MRRNSPQMVAQVLGASGECLKSNRLTNGDTVGFKAQVNYGLHDSRVDDQSFKSALGGFKAKLKAASTRHAIT